MARTADNLSAQHARLFQRWLELRLKRWRESGKSLEELLESVAGKGGELVSLPIRDRDWLNRIRPGAKAHAPHVPRLKAIEIALRLSRLARQTIPENTVNILLRGLVPHDEPLLIVPEGSAKPVAARIAQIVQKHGRRISARAQLAVEKYLSEFEVFERELPEIRGALHVFRTKHKTIGIWQMLRGTYRDGNIYSSPSWDARLEQIALTLHFDKRRDS